MGAHRDAQKKRAAARLSRRSGWQVEWRPDFGGGYYGNRGASASDPLGLLSRWRFLGETAAVADRRLRELTGRGARMTTPDLYLKVVELAAEVVRRHVPGHVPVVDDDVLVTAWDGLRGLTQAQRQGIVDRARVDGMVGDA